MDTTCLWVEQCPCHDPRLETLQELGPPMEGITGCFSSKRRGIGTVPMSQAWSPHSPQTQPGVEPQHS